MSIHAPIPKFGVQPNYDFFLSRFANLAKSTTSAGVLLAIGQNVNGRFSNAAADGDKHYLYFLCDGTETKLEITTRKITVAGKWDIYVNGVLDSSGYDDYAAAAADISREITLSEPIRPGMNTVELRLNGKNAASGGYYISIYGASLQ